MRRLLTGILLLPLAANAQLRVAPIFSNHMVLQRDAPIRIWGKSLPDKSVTVRFAGKEQKTLAGKDSSWRVSFPPQKFNASPQSIFISCDHQKIELEDVLIGDLWIASGQSNMEWPMVREMHWKAETANTDQPLIRLNSPPPAGRYVYGVPYNDSLNKIK
ncbi:hypothetical protein [Chitinophaga sp.]|uniref:hypothetical protein n=1 Tax=Chitinophaga sp. TaxID=1869181 RepID=UPI0031D5C89B